MEHRVLNKQFNGKHTHIKSRCYIRRDKAVLDEFYTEPVISMVNGEDATRYVDPIYVLLNQKRLAQVGTDSVKAMVDEMNANLSVSDNPLAELRKQCSDEDLLRTIKSRRIQSPSELLQWARYMRQNSKEFNEHVKKSYEESSEVVMEEPKQE